MAAATEGRAEAVDHLQGNGDLLGGGAAWQGMSSPSLKEWPQHRSEA